MGPITNSRTGRLAKLPRKGYIGFQDLIGDCWFKDILLKAPAGSSAGATTAGPQASLPAPEPMVELGRITGHDAQVEQVHLRPDGKTILTTSQDGTARLWDLASGRGAPPPPPPRLAGWVRWGCPRPTAGGAITSPLITKARKHESTKKRGTEIPPARNRSVLFRIFVLSRFRDHEPTPRVGARGLSTCGAGRPAPEGPSIGGRQHTRAAHARSGHGAPSRKRETVVRRPGGLASPISRAPDSKSGRRAEDASYPDARQNIRGPGRTSRSTRQDRAADVSLLREGWSCPGPGALACEFRLLACKTARATPSPHDPPFPYSRPATNSMPQPCKFLNAPIFPPKVLSL